MTFYHNNKRKVFPLELSTFPRHCTKLTDDCYIVVDGNVRLFENGILILFSNW